MLPDQQRIHQQILHIHTTVINSGCQLLSLFNYVWFVCFHLYYLHFCISLYTRENVICIKLLLTYLLTYLLTVLIQMTNTAPIFQTKSKQAHTSPWITRSKMRHCLLNFHPINKWALSINWWHSLFCCCTATWNRLPMELKLLQSTDSFSHDLEAFLFDSVYGHQDTDRLCEAPSVFQKGAQYKCLRYSYS